MSKAATSIIERFLIVWLCLLSYAAYEWQSWFSSGKEAAFDPFAASAPFLWYLIAVTMFAIGWMLPRDEIRQVIRRWPTVLGGTAVQYGSMPLLAYALGRLMRLDEDAMIGIIMVGCVPGAMASNVLTLVARGNVSYSLSLTTSATLLSPLVVPLALAVALGQQDVDFPARETAQQLLFFVVVPVVVGHLLGRRFVKWQQPARRAGTTVANLAILWIIAVVVAVNRDKVEAIDARLLVALLSLNACGYAAGFLGGRAMRLPAGMRRALTLEVGMQNAGLGATLALALFADRTAVAIPAATYTFGCMFTGTILARTWAIFGEAGDAPEPTEVGESS